MADDVQLPSTFFRWAEDDELRDFRECGILRPCPKSSYDGKHATTSVAHARQWAAVLGGGGAVLMIEVLEPIAAGAYYLGDRLDGIGPGWFVSFTQLEQCCISEVPD